MKHIYSLNATGGWCWLIAFLTIITCATNTHAQVKGVVFRDFDSNGIRSDTLPIETGIGGVTVRAFVGFSQLPVVTTTSNDGTYSFNNVTIPAGQSVRIEFDNFQSGYYNSSYGSSNGTSVQFVKAPADNVNMGINYPVDYCQPTGKLLVTSCYVNGNSQTILDKDGNPVPPEKQSALTDALISMPYEISGIAGPGNFPPTHLATAGEIGAVWGITYQRRARKVFSTAFAKRHTSFGPGGPGGIYVTDIATGTSTTFMSVSAVGIDMGEDPHKDPLANLFGDKTQASTDPGAMSAVGRMSFGGVDMSEDDKTLYFINLKDRKLYSLFVGLPAVVPTSAAAVQSWAIPNPGCSNGDYRPWALKVYRGKIYVGVVCSAETSQLQSDLKATIYRFDPQAASPVFEEVLSFPLTYQRGPLDITGTCITNDHWLPWTDAWPTPCGVGSTPRFEMSDQAMVVDLEFDDDGSMMIGMLSRFAHLGGTANHDPSGNGLYDSFGFGDVLRAYNNNGNFELEKNGKAGPLTGTGVGNHDGPEDENGVGGEFYGQDYWTFFANVADREITTGGLSFAPGYNEIINSAIDPIDERYLSAGFRVFNARAGTATRSYELFSQVAGLFAKAGALGDNELICDPAPLEIGNRFWFDDNRNGVQDAYEPGIDGVALTLHDMGNGGIQIATQTTHDGGQFYFNKSTVPGGLLYNHPYEVRMDTAQLSVLDITVGGVQPLSGSDRRHYSLTQANNTNFANPDLRDSDAQLVGGTAIISVTTLDAGQNDFTNDLGIYDCPEIQNEQASLTVCSGMGLGSLATQGHYLSQMDSVRFVLFSSPQSGTAMYGNGGTAIGTVKPDPTTGRAVLQNPSLNTVNNTAGPVTQYIYALIYPTPADPGCRQSSQTILTISPAMSASATGGEITCATPQLTLSGQAHYGDGSAAPNATYQWAGPNGFTSSQQNPTVSAEGSYTLTIGDPACPSFSSQAIVVVTANTTPPSASINALTLTCTNPSGTLTASVTGGASPYTYLWSNGQTTASITASTSGPYSVTVTGANGCIAMATTSVMSDLMPPSASVNSLTLTCIDPSGTLTASVTGGTAPYTYLWSMGQTAASITVSSAGPYSVTVTGASGCVSTATTSVLANTRVPIASINSLTLTCTDPLGILTASVTGGMEPYTYLWSTGQSIASITARLAGPYSVTVTGANGCITTVNTTVSADKTAPTASINNLTLTCPDPSGTLTASVSGGTAPFTYLWSTNANTPSITVGSAGSYSVLVTGANGCSASAVASVVSGTEQPSVSINTLTLTCAGPSGTLTASITGGTSPFTYLWSNGQTTASITTNTGGPYSVTVTGAIGCVTTANTVVLVNMAVPTASVNSLMLTCADPSGTLTANITGGTTPFNYLWSNGQSTASIITNADGPYSVTVTGANGCLTTATTTITSDKAVPTASVNSLTLTCTNSSGTLTANASGGTTPYTYLWSTNANTPSITVGSAGFYSVLVTGANGCSASAVASVVSGTDQPTVSLNSLTLTCNDPSGTLTASVSGGTAPFTYLWSTNANTPSITVSTAGPYSVTVSGANGCMATASTSVMADKVAPVILDAYADIPECYTCTAVISVTVSPQNATLLWTGPDSYTSDQATNVVSGEGLYLVTVTGPNGCTAQTDVEVHPVQNDDPCPLITSQGKALSLCAGSPVPPLSVTVVATGTYATSQIRFVYSATQLANPADAYQTGTTLGSVAIVNGVATLSNPAVPTSNTTAQPLLRYVYALLDPTPFSPICRPVVEQLIQIAPVISASATGGAITCATPQVTLMGQARYGDGSTAPNTTYQWTGPNSFSSNQPNPVVSVAGAYTLTVGTPGCSSLGSQAVAQVTSNTVTPVMTTSVTSRTCVSCSATLSANAPGAILNWTGPNSFTATGSPIQVTTDGTYSVTATGSNGCQTSASLAVVPFACSPALCIPIIVRKNSR